MRQKTLFNNYYTTPSGRVNKIPIYEIKLIKTAYITGDPTFSDPEDVAKILKTIYEGTDREEIKILMLNSKNQIIGIHTPIRGTLEQAPAYFREIFKAILIANAAALILTHNHPSGCPNPSQEDKKMTDKLYAIANDLGVRVLDHFIVGETTAYSLQTCRTFNLEN